MNIGGWQKVSLIDYPGTVSTVIFTSGCPFRCSFCHNPSLVIPPFETRVPENDIVDYLKRRQGKIFGVVITGGEPLMQKDIPAFCKKLKRLGYKIKLDTNGYYPEQLKGLVSEKLLDYIAMDIKAPLEKYPELVQRSNLNVSRIQESIQLLLSSNIPYEFRTTVIEGYHSPEDVESMAKLVKGAKKLIFQSFLPKDRLVNSEFSSYPQTTPDFLLQCQRRTKDIVQQCEIR